MANVFGGSGVNRVFADVSGMIADAFEVTRDKHQIDVAAQLLGITCHAIDQLSAHLRVHFIKRVILRNNGAGGLRILAHISIHAVAEHRHGMFDHWVQQKNLRQRGMLVQFARFTGNVGGLIGHSLEIGAQFHRRDDATQIGRDRLKTQQQFNPFLINLLFQLIDLLVIGDGDRGDLVVPFHQTFERAIEAALGLARHRHDVVAEVFECVLECSQSVFVFAEHSC